MRVNKTIYCDKCCGEITSKDDLVISNKFLSLVSYHEKCYSSELKGLSTIFVGNSPINGPMANIMTVVAAIVGIALLFVPKLRYISILSFLSICVRFYAWFKYERYL